MTKTQRPKVRPVIYLRTEGERVEATILGHRENEEFPHNLLDDARTGIRVWFYRSDATGRIARFSTAWCVSGDGKLLRATARLLDKVERELAAGDASCVEGDDLAVPTINALARATKADRVVTQRSGRGGVRGYYRDETWNWDTLHRGVDLLRGLLDALPGKEVDA